MKYVKNRTLRAAFIFLALIAVGLGLFIGFGPSGNTCMQVVAFIAAVCMVGWIIRNGVVRQRELEKGRSR